MYCTRLKAVLFLATCLAAFPRASFAGDKEDRLADAVRSRDHDSIKQLLAAGAQPNQRLTDRSLPLAWAIDRKDVESVHLLLAAGASPNATDFYNNPLLTLACEIGDDDVVLSLVSRGADVKASRGDGITALALCSGYAGVQAIKALVDKGADVNVADRNGQTPLMRAAAAGAVDNIGLLITLGANIDAATPRGATPIFFALQSGNRQAPNMFLDAGARTTGLTPDGQTIVEASLAVQNETFAGDVMKKGVDISARNMRGWQLIHTLAAGGYTELVKLAISMGADPNSLSQPPVEPGKRELAANGNVGVPDRADAEKPKQQKNDERIPLKNLTAPAPPSPRTPLMLAAAEGHIETMKALVAAGARPNTKAPDGLTVTLAAVTSGDVPTVTYALTLDPNIAARAQGGKTVLHLAVRSTNTQGAEALLPFLVKKGAKLDATDDRDVTAGDIVNRAGPGNLRTVYNKLLKEGGFPIPERKFSVD